MFDKRPASFKFFIGVIITTAIAFAVATVLSVSDPEKKYAMIPALIMFIAFAFTPAGIYSGLRYKAAIPKARTLNIIGLVGNVIIFVFTIALMTYAALT